MFRSNPLLPVICLIWIFCASFGAPVAGAKYEKGRLSSLQFDSLKTYLARIDASPKDTLIIKYDFDGESCWDQLDLQSDDYISRVVLSARNRKSEIERERPGVSVYNLRETGSAFNKLKLRDHDIKIDSGGFVRRLLFQKKQGFGSSCIILPSGDYILVKSDAHFEALNLSGKKITSILVRTSFTR